MSSIEKALGKLNQKKDSQKASSSPANMKHYPGAHSETLNQARIHIDSGQLSGLDFVSSDGVLPYLADEYRRIKRPILANAFGNEAQLVQHGNLVMVTSSLPGEGKSFTASNLALSMATEKDRTVLLIDADVTKSRVSQLAGLQDHKGLVDLLTNESMDVASVMVKTNFPGLRIIPSGGQHAHINELLSSERMASLLNELANRYHNRIILFDGPPILVTPETQILADRMGQIIFVVEMGKTPRNVVDQALALLPNEDKAVSLVLNKARKQSGYQGVGYGGYGGY